MLNIDQLPVQPTSPSLPGLHYATSLTVQNGRDSVQCAKDPQWYLQKHAWIQHRTTGQNIKWKAWPYLTDLIQILQNENDVVILKARQLGFSWLIAAYGEWKVKFSEAGKALYLSQREDDAWSLLSKSRFIWEHCPEHLRFPLEHDGQGWLHFWQGGEIKALPSTQDAGRGTDATFVLRDELAMHPEGEKNYTSIRPAIDAGGQLVDLSTINKLDYENHFTDRVERAYKGSVKRTLPSGLEVYTGGESKACLIFASWRLRPVRQEGLTLDEWFDRNIKPKYTSFQIEQEYPASIQQALNPVETKSFFDRKALDEMTLQVDEPKRDVPFDTHNGIVRFYKLPSLSRRYVVFTDPSTGSEDPFATVVMDVATGEWVCTATGNIPAQEVARIHDELVKTYNKAYNAAEVNAQAGGIVLETLNNLETPNVAPRRGVDGKVVFGKKGWLTVPTMRDRVLDDYATAIRLQLITIHDRDAIAQHKYFIYARHGDKLRAEQVRGKHDDWIMAGSGAWAIAKYAPKAEGLVVYSGQYRG